MVSDQLRIKILNLVRRMVYVSLGGFGRCALHKEDVVVRVLFAKVEMHERHDIDFGEVPVVQDVRGHEVEVVRVPFQFFVKLAVDVAEVA